MDVNLILSSEFYIPNSTHNMEHLTKAQIVLLTLFTSFVASMATGIVVVTLMQQAPGPVLQSITNVVERTIEKITPTIVEKPGKQVIIKDEDLVVAAIERNTKSVVAFRVAGEDGTRSAGIGTIVSSDGLVLTDKGNLGGGVLTTTVDGIAYALDVIPSDSGTLVLGKLTPVIPLATSTPPTTFVSATLGDSSVLKVGQTTIVIGGRDGKTIATGLVTNLDTHIVTDKDTKAETKILDSIGVSQHLAGTSNGAPIITLEGVVVGFLSIDDSVGTQAGIPASVAKTLISSQSVAGATPSKKTP